MTVTRQAHSPGGYLTYQRARIPGGHLTVVVDPQSDIVVYATFAEPTAQLAKQSDRLRKHVNATVDAALEAYGDGDLSRIETIAVSQPGSDFRQRAWRAMRDLPAGSVITYSALAQRVGNPGAARAAGTACAKNQIPIFVPCHRVVATQGLGGYAFGLAVKEQLLRHEGWELERPREKQRSR